MNKNQQIYNFKFNNNNNQLINKMIKKNQAKNNIILVNNRIYTHKYYKNKQKYRI